jgi:hypothetical protein
MPDNFPWCFDHMRWLVDTGEQQKTADGKEVEVWEFRHEKDEAVLSAWAKHFRNHYCLDTQIDALRSGTGCSRADFLNNIKFPDKSAAPGPSIRAGDFAEILAADYLEFYLNHWVPRSRYVNKTVRNESTKGVDTVGFFFENDGSESVKDKLTIIESKAKYTGQHDNRLQTAIDHSGKDVTRKAESLNSIKQRFLDKEDIASANRVERFQDEMDRPYTQQYGAFAHLDVGNYSIDAISTANVLKHPFKRQLFLIVIKGNQMMELVHELFKRAADEA